jgi:hypothetical protein
MGALLGRSVMWGRKVAEKMGKSDRVEEIVARRRLFGKPKAPRLVEPARIKRREAARKREFLILPRAALQWNVGID